VYSCIYTTDEQQSNSLSLIIIQQQQLIHLSNSSKAKNQLVNQFFRQDKLINIIKASQATLAIILDFFFAYQTQLKRNQLKLNHHNPSKQAKRNSF
jgi:hypothetical protein